MKSPENTKSKYPLVAEKTKPQTISATGMETPLSGKLVTLIVDDGAKEYVHFFSPEDAMEVANLLNETAVAVLEDSRRVDPNVRYTGQKNGSLDVRDGSRKEMNT